MHQKSFQNYLFEEQFTFKLRLHNNDEHFLDAKRIQLLWHNRESICICNTISELRLNCVHVGVKGTQSGAAFVRNTIFPTIQYGEDHAWTRVKCWLLHRHYNVLEIMVCHGKAAVRRIYQPHVPKWPRRSRWAALPCNFWVGRCQHREVRKRGAASGTHPRWKDGKLHEEQLNQTIIETKSWPLWLRTSNNNKIKRNGTEPCVTRSRTFRPQAVRVLY